MYSYPITRLRENKEQDKCTYENPPKSATKPQKYGSEYYMIYIWDAK